MVFELLYTSAVSPTFHIGGLADIIRRARSYNREHDLTAVLVFDGERFCQHIEGNREAVLLLAERIARDPRHQHFTLLHQGFAGPARRFEGWHLRYALEMHGDSPVSRVMPQGPGAVALLQHRIASLAMVA